MTRRLNRNQRRRLAALTKRKATADRSKVDREAVDNPFIVRHPLSDVPRDILRTAFLERANEAKADIPRLKNDLLIKLRKSNPLHVLTLLSQSATFAGITNDDKIWKSKSPRDKALQQFHVELAQAACLSLPASEVSGSPCSPQIIQAISDTLYDLCEAFEASQLGSLEGVEGQQSKEELLLRERIKMHTLAVRNWAYYSQCKRILRDLLAPLDGECERITGFAATDFIDLFDKMLRSIESDMTEYYRRLASVFAKETKRAIIEAYVREFHLPVAQVDSLMEFVRQRGVGRRNLLMLIVAHSGVIAVEIFRFDVAKLVKISGISAEKLSRGIDRVALNLGSLVDTPIERFLLANPVWEKPVIKMGEHSYFCFLPQLFFGFSFSIFSSIFSADESARRRMALRRASYLESEVEKILADAFGHQLARSNVRWIYAGTQYETDLLVQVDSQLFIIEAKSHRVTWPALRGAPDRVKRQVNELFVEPAAQSHRLERAIREWQAGDRSRLTWACDIDLEHVQDITRLSITLEDFATIQSNLREVARSGLLPADIPFPVTISLPDLETVFAILDNPVERIFYLKRRSELQTAGAYLADEMDLLGLYLATGLELGDVEDGQSHILTSQMSDKVDEYFQLLDQGVSPPRPCRRMTPWFEAIRDRLSLAKPYRWTEAAATLMRFDHESQLEIEDRFRHIRAAVIANKPDQHGGDDSLIVLSPRWKDTGLACLAFRNIDREKRHERMEGASIQVIQQSSVARCLVIAADAEGQNYPYATLMMFDRPKDVPRAM